MCLNLVNLAFIILVNQIIVSNLFNLSLLDPIYFVHDVCGFHIVVVHFLICG